MSMMSTINHRKVLRAVVKAFVDARIVGCCIPTGIIAHELGKKCKDIDEPIELELGYVYMPALKQCTPHVWIKVGNKRYDIAGEVLKLCSGRSVPDELSYVPKGQIAVDEEGIEDVMSKYTAKLNENFSDEEQSKCRKEYFDMCPMMWHMLQAADILVLNDFAVLPKLKTAKVNM
jgi:hypothetical protein